MNVKQTRKYEMLARVQGFGARHPQAFPEGSHAASLLASVSSAAAALSSHSTAKAAGADVVRSGTAVRLLAHEALRKDLRSIQRSARAIARRVPTLGGKFRLPVRMRSLALIDMARAFLGETAPYRAEFAQLALGDAFFAKVEADIAALGAALGSQRLGRETKLVASAAMKQALATGEASVRELDALVRNFFEGDAVALSAWEAASRVQQSGSGGRARGAAESPSAESAA